MMQQETKSLILSNLPIKLNLWRRKIKKKINYLSKLILIIVVIIALSLLAMIIFLKNSTQINTKNSEITTEKTYISDSGFSVNYPNQMNEYPYSLEDKKGVTIGYPDSDNTISFIPYPNPDDLSESNWWNLNGVDLLLQQQSKTTSIDPNFKNYTLSTVEFGENEYLFAKNTKGLGSQYFIVVGKNIINIIPGFMNEEQREKILSSFRFTK